MLNLNNSQNIVISENDVLVRKALIKDKIFYLWFDKQCGDRNKTYGKDVIYKDSEKTINFEVSLFEGMAEIKTEMILKNRFHNVIRTTERMSIDKLESMALYEIIKIINKQIQIL